MKRAFSVVCVLSVCAAAFGQESDVTTSKTIEPGNEDLMSSMWFMEDATPIETGTVDLRIGFNWVTSTSPANVGDSDDDYILTPEIVWGACDNVEVSLRVPAWIGDGGDRESFQDGNYDTYVGMLWRVHEQEGYHPAIALSSTVRIPTGDGSRGIDAELRAVFSNEYDSGVRSHVNIFGATVNTNNADNPRMARSTSLGKLFAPNASVGFGSKSLDPRSFQWGFVIGMDGPLCRDGAVRWVADYMIRSSQYDGRSSMNMVELGSEWNIADGHKLGLSTQIGLDHTGDTPNFGAGFAYSYTIGS